MDLGGSDEYGFPQTLESVLDALIPDSLAAHLDRDRPYDGQAHTNYGTRGAQEISGVTMRDLVDAFFRACYESSGLAVEDWPGSIYDLPWNEMSIIAVFQNLTLNVEKIMGIYPNVPRFVYPAMEPHWCGPRLEGSHWRAHHGPCEVFEKCGYDSEKQHICELH